jgi:hypothetical protein
MTSIVYRIHTSLQSVMRDIRYWRQSIAGYNGFGIQHLKRTPEYIEGPEAWTRFDAAMKGVMGVSHTEIQRRIEVERERAALNPNRRGPKPKKKLGASPVPDASLPS